MINKVRLELIFIFYKIVNKYTIRINSFLFIYINAPSFSRHAMASRKRALLLILAVLVTLVVVFYFLNEKRSRTASSDQFLVNFAPIKYDEDERLRPLPHLVNLTNFAYIIKAECHHPQEQGSERAATEPLLAVFIVTSYVGHDDQRRAHRTAMSSATLRSLRLRRVFLLADIPPHEKFITQAAIQDEHKRFNDIVQGNFVEAYRNLTYKHVMGLRWAATECADASFVVKMDDDTVFDSMFVYNYLGDLIDQQTDTTTGGGSEQFLAGYTLSDKKPIRNAANKWYVSPDEFPGALYPNYLSGWFYITNPLTARRLVIASQRNSFMWIDDVWVTGVLREPLGIPLTDLSKWFAAFSTFLDCCIADANERSLLCDYYVGPNDGDHNLIVTFNAAMARCYEYDGERAGCVERKPDDKSSDGGGASMMKPKCVGQVKVFNDWSHGEGQVHAVKL